MKINNVYIVANSIKRESAALSLEIKAYLESLGITVRIDNINTDDDKLDIPFNTDLVITLGGDGTVLYASRFVAELGIPIFPVNLGTFGYITEIGKNEWRESFDQYRAEGKNVSRRLMLRITVERDGQKVFSSTALNEAVVSSSGIAKVISLDLQLDRTDAGHFRSDGMIIATPTGSTGYSLAAGGPILDAEMSAVVITPICPFTLSNRPLVTGDKTVTINVTRDQRTEVVLTVDGQEIFDLKEGDKVVVEKSRIRMLLIHNPNRNFTTVIREKLNWSGEMHA